MDTLPGALTVSAALVSAVAGLIVAVNQIWPRSHDESTPASLEPGTVRGGSQERESSSSAALRAEFPSGVRARVGDALYEIIGTDAQRGNPGQVELALTIRLSNPSPYDANFWDRTFRLLVDHVPRAPTSGLDEIVAARSAKEGTVTFVVPDGARHLVLLVGEPEGQAVRLPVVLEPRES
ncbi:MAG: hypothetical protein ICV74_09615 [Thermoleophilia bacterium]|nr:hypothetical protein [Thermoleophilia bacterium]